MTMSSDTLDKKLVRAHEAAAQAAEAMRVSGVLAIEEPDDILEALAILDMRTAAVRAELQRWIDRRDRRQLRAG